LSIWFSLLWGVALLGLLLLPANYRAGAESAHAHSLFQLWAEAANGTIRHHPDHGPAHAWSGGSSSWFDPAVGDIEPTPSVGFDGQRPDVAAQQESAPVSSGVDLLLTTTIAIVALGIRQAPIDVPDRRLRDLPPRTRVPPPRWTPAAS
jgi:hypothetical protein